MVIFINQIRMKIGVMYGSPETTTGGNALKFYASVRLDIRRTGQIKSRRRYRRQHHPGERLSRTRSLHLSNRSNSTSCMAKVFPRPGELLDLGVKAGIVEKSGSWFSYDSIRIGQGRENSKKLSHGKS